MLKPGIYVLLTFITLTSSGRMSSAKSSSVRDNAPQQTSTFADRNPRYRIHPADVLDIVFPLASDFNQTVSVQPDGYIGLRGVSEVNILGMTLPQASTALRTAYSKIMLDPHFTLTLKDFVKPTYIVSGEVKSPGDKLLRGEVTVTQAVMGAGGFTADAKHSQVLLFRRYSNNWFEVKQIDLKHMLKSRNLSEDVMVQPGDIIFVPKSAMGKISRFLPTYTVGSYLGPGSF